jgi:serine/threonine-protein kinase
MAYEMLSGKLPFKADTAWEWATQHMTQPPIPIESLAEGQRATEAMRSALRKALAKSPDERFQTVTEFCDAFCGRGAAPGVAAAGPGTPRARTEVGAPLDLGAAFGPPTGMGMPPGPPGPPVQGYTPVGGNVAFPTPAGIPQPPPRQPKGGGNRTPLLIVAGVIGLASVAAIGFAVKGSSGAKAVDFDNSNTNTAVASAAETAAPVDSNSGGDIPPLNGGGATPPHPQPHGNPNPNPGPNPTPPHTNPTPNPTPPPTPTTPPAPQPSPGKYDGPECQKARTLRALNHPKEAQTWALACIAKGGSP